MLRRILGIVLALATAGVLAQEPARPPRLSRPWSQLTSLTDQQRQALVEIRSRTLEQIRQLEQRQRQEMLAVLTTRQVDELRLIEERELAQRKLRNSATLPAPVIELAPDTPEKP